MSGLYRLGGQVIHAWGATGAVRPLVDAALRGVRPAGKASRGSSPREKPRVSAEALAAALKADLAKVGATEREAIVKQRVGQLVFREALLDLWDGKCAVTGLAIPDLLRASHAKPWTDCTSKAERLDPFNGLLLAPHLDALFDRGYVTFDDRGKGVWSAEVSPAALAALGLAGATPVLRWIDPRHAPYLAYHREHVFRGARDVHTTGQ